jgi:hypothetical protein
MLNIIFIRLEVLIAFLMTHLMGVPVLDLYVDHLLDRDTALLVLKACLNALHPLSILPGQFRQCTTLMLPRELLVLILLLVFLVFLLILLVGLLGPLNVAAAGRRAAGILQCFLVLPTRLLQRPASALPVALVRGRGAVVSGRRRRRRLVIIVMVLDCGGGVGGGGNGAVALFVGGGALVCY